MKISDKVELLRLAVRLFEDEPVAEPYVRLFRVLTGELQQRLVDPNPRAFVLEKSQ